MKTIRLILLAPLALLAIGLNSCQKDATPAPAKGIQNDNLSSKALKHVPTNPKKTLTEGLVAYYPFSGNANDESGNGYNGTVFGATLTAGKSGHKNSAYSFNGSNHIELPFSMGDSVVQFSVYSRIKSTSTGTLWDSGYEPGAYCSFYVEPGSVSYAEERTIPSLGRLYADAKGNISPETPIETWNDVVVNFNSGIITVYVNGKPVSLTYRLFANAALDRMPAPGINGMRIGAHFNVKFAVLLGIPFIYYLTGTVDELRFYNRLLTAAEIDYLYKH